VTLGNKSYGSFAFRGAAMQEATLQALANTIAVGLAQVQAQEAGSRAEAVRKSEELKSVMIDALAHELKTPLTAIEAAADMLRQPGAVTPEQREDLLGVIRQESKGLRRLMGEAIHLARIEAKRFRLEMETLPLEELITAGIDSLGDRAGTHVIQVEVGKPGPTIYADRELMIQVVKQLVDNATKYSPARSVITVTGSEDNGLVRLSVRDQGQGLTELEQGRVFDKFYRAKRERAAVQGTGMGLSIAREIAEAHGGSISVESQQGQGSRFTITMQSAAVRQTA
jgi:two-component system sensor histidine kinase KdpD